MKEASSGTAAAGVKTPEPGWRMTITPTKPMAMAVHRRQPTFSPSTGPTARRRGGVGHEDGVGVDEADHGEGEHHDADLGREEEATDDLDHRALGRRRRPDAARLTGGERHDEGREEPEADHHDHEDVVVFGQMPGQRVLHREDERGGNHVEDAEAEVLFAHASRAAVMWRLRP